jgi:hypothetical protein
MENVGFYNDRLGCVWLGSQEAKVEMVETLAPVLAVAAVAEQLAAAEDSEPSMEELMATAMTSEAPKADRVAERSMWISKWRLRQFESSDL